MAHNSSPAKFAVDLVHKVVLLVVVMTEDLLLVEVLDLSVTVVVELDLLQDFPMVLLGIRT